MSDSLIIRAAQYAAKCHAEQTRKYSDAPYITHPMRVAARVMMFPWATPELVAAAILHDVAEDCDVTLAQIEALFGKQVAMLVGELTNPTKGMKAPRAERKRLDREHIAKISLEAKRIKLIDRIDNLKELPLLGQGEDEFVKMYCAESKLLLEVLRGVDDELEQELADVIAWKLTTFDERTI